ncbi:MAG TPA: cytochrome c [Flavisolibacter sp.]|jgi:mono/diheme cytochrome c family protein|nr:cytochrome c [Flavisolibacter sp.]
MKCRFLFFALITSLLLQAAPPVEEGKTIFTSRCAGCHNINKQVLGPALAGVDERRSMDWIVNFVQSSQSLIKSGDKDAVALFKQFNNIPMPDHKDLSAEQIKSVVAFIQTEAQAATAVKKDVKPNDQTAPSFLSIVGKSPSLIAVFSILALMLASVLLFAYKVKQYQRNVAAGK